MPFRRLCARPGCGAPAVTTLRFQPTLRQAWLIDLDETSARTQGDLCRRHAEALVLPRGWELHDERTDRGAAPPSATAPPPSAPAPRRVRVRKRAAAHDPSEDAPSQLPGFEPAANGHAAIEEDDPVAVTPVDEPEVDVEPEPEVDDEIEPDVIAARTVPAQFGANDGDDDDVDDEALSAILDARTPLLQRAFRNARPGT